MICKGEVYHSVNYVRAVKCDTRVFSTTEGLYFIINKIVTLNIEDEVKCVLLCKKIVPIKSTQFPATLKNALCHSF